MSSDGSCSLIWFDRMTFGVCYVVKSNIVSRHCVDLSWHLWIGLSVFCFFYSLIYFCLFFLLMKFNFSLSCLSWHSTCRVMNRGQQYSYFIFFNYYFFMIGLSPWCVLCFDVECIRAVIFTVFMQGLAKKSPCRFYVTSNRLSPVHGIMKNRKIYITQLPNEPRFIL